MTSTRSLAQAPTAPALCVAWNQRAWTYADLARARRRRRAALALRTRLATRRRASRCCCAIRRSTWRVLRRARRRLRRRAVERAGTRRGARRARSSTAVLARCIGRPGAPRMRTAAAAAARERDARDDADAVRATDERERAARVLRQHRPATPAPPCRRRSATISALHHLHLGHDRAAEGRDAEPRQSRANARAIVAVPRAHRRRSRLLRAAVSFLVRQLGAAQPSRAPARTLLLEDNFAFPQRSLQRMQDDARHRFRRRAVDVRAAARPLPLARLRSRHAALRHAGRRRHAARRPSSGCAQQLPHTQLFVMYGQTEATARVYLSAARAARRQARLGRHARCRASRSTVRIRTAVRCPPARSARSARAARTSCWATGTTRRRPREVLRDGWLRTGDLGHQDADGFLYIDGRAVEMIKVGAFRVSPQEVEEVIAAARGRRGSRGRPRCPTRCWARRSRPSSCCAPARQLDAARREGALPPAPRDLQGSEDRGIRRASAAHRVGQGATLQLI